MASVNAAEIPTRRRTVDKGTMTGPTSGMETNLLNKVNQAYAGQPTNERKAQFINSVLDNEDIALENKIIQIQALVKVITADIRLNSGWFYNDDQTQIDWLYEQQVKVSNKLSDIQWQVKSYAEKAAWNTAKYTSMYLGVILAAYLAQDQLSKEQLFKFSGSEVKSTFGELSLMPIELIIKLAKSAVINTAEFTKNTVTGETAQKTAAIGLAAGKAAGELVYDAATTIGTKGINSLQSEVHEVSQSIAHASEPIPPTWLDTLLGKSSKLIGKISTNDMVNE